jgi:lysophospholipase L1-like esterase
VGTAKPQEESYPACLQRILGPRWEVKNFGAGGRTLLRKADAYNYGAAMKFQPDVVIIALGTNDARAETWNRLHDDFFGDYVKMVSDFQKLPSHPRIWACLPVPAFAGNYGIKEELVRDAVIPEIRRAAEKATIPTIDLHTPLLPNKEWFRDSIHPNREGAQRIAEVVASVIAPR